MEKPGPKPNLIHEFDKRIERIRRTCNEAQLQALLKSLDQFLSSVSVVPKPLVVKETPPPPPPSRNAYVYLYVQSYERLSRLNVTKLSEAPVFELVCDFGRSHRRDCLSSVVCFDAESDILMVGDVFLRDGERRQDNCKPFLDVLSIDTGKSPSFRPCPPTIAPGLAAPKVDPMVVSLHGKTYVLALHFSTGEPSFEVFDHGKWKTLAPPPFVLEFRDNGLYPSNCQSCFYAVYAWDHKIVVCFQSLFSYCFDTKTGQWIDMQNIYVENEDAPVLQCVAEYDKFLIAKPFDSEELVVYELDTDGFPHFYQNLDGIEEMFADSPINFSTNAFIIPFDDDADKFCFTCSGLSPKYLEGGRFEFFLRAAVFRMAISNLDGKNKLTAVLEAHQIFPFYQLARSQHICSAFLKRDNLNLDNLKADPSLGRALSKKSLGRALSKKSLGRACAD